MTFEEIKSYVILLEIRKQLERHRTMLVNVAVPLKFRFRVKEVTRILEKVSTIIFVKRQTLLLLLINFKGIFIEELCDWNDGESDSDVIFVEVKDDVEIFFYYMLKIFYLSHEPARLFFTFLFWRIGLLRPGERTIARDDLERNFAVHFYKLEL